MPEPQSYPTVRYYEDGRFVLVETLAEYAAIEPGHADNPSGPFPALAPPPSAPCPSGEPSVEEEKQERFEMVPPVSNADLHARARAMRAEGMTQQAIAEHFGISRRTVRQWLED